jgi:hypothetical protein
MTSEKITCLVISARAIAIRGGIIDRKPALIDSNSIMFSFYFIVSAHKAGCFVGYFWV